MSGVPPAGDPWEQKPPLAAGAVTVTLLQVATAVRAACLRRSVGMAVPEALMHMQTCMPCADAVQENVAALDAGRAAMTCPRCAAGPGRQDPLYEEGAATGVFACEACHLTYRPVNLT